MTLPILAVFNQGKFQLVMSQFLFDELHEVWQRPRLLKRIDRGQALYLETKLKERADWIDVTTGPSRCRDPKDLPVLATAIDGKASSRSTKAARNNGDEHDNHNERDNDNDDRTDE